MQKNFFLPMQLTGQLTSRSAPAPAKKSNIVMSDLEVSRPAGDHVKDGKGWLSLGDVELDGSLKQGKCISWNIKKGFGAIGMEGEEKQIFVHFSEIQTEAEGFK